MIENMRKYTGLMVVVFILLGAGFLFTMNDIGGSRPSLGGGKAVMTAYGESIDGQAYARMGERTQRLAADLNLMLYLNFLSTSANSSDFIVNRMTIQRAMDEMGLYASEEQVTETLKTMPRFAPGGSYDAAAYTTYVNKRLGRLGMTEKDLREIVREALCLEKLLEIIGGGLTAPRSAVLAQIEAQQQTVTLVRVLNNRDDFVEKENPTEEEIKAYWEANKDAFKTEEKRRISYLHLDIPDKLDEKADQGNDKKSDAEKDKEAAEAQAKGEETDKKVIAARELNREMAKISDVIVTRFNEKLDLDLENQLKKLNHTLVPTELFTMADAPAALKDLTLRGNSFRERSLINHIFAKAASDKEYDQISEPLPVGEHGWIIYRLDEVIEPTLLDYAAARAKVRARLISENATRKVKQATEQAREKILAAMKTGKTFDDAAKEVGLTPVQVGPYSPFGIPPKNEHNHARLHEIARGLNAGELSEAIHESDRSLLIFVQKREIEENPMLARMAEFQNMQADRLLSIMTANQWLQKQREKAELKVLVKE